jgi:quercetin dioxygenase-like cupin family protein
VLAERKRYSAPDGPGEVVLVPANTEHDIKILEDLEVINVKNVVPGWSVKHATWEM